jgi:hypothetical protein
MMPMKKMAAMCLNWKVLLALAMVGVGIWVLAPKLFLAALPVLLIAACPLSMLLMGWGMKRAMESKQHASLPSQGSQPNTPGPEPTKRLVELEAKKAALEHEVVQLQTAIEQQKNSRPTAPAAKRG